jgi:hypothetical protein
VTHDGYKILFFFFSFFFFFLLFFFWVFFCCVYASEYKLCTDLHSLKLTDSRFLAKAGQARQGCPRSHSIFGYRRKRKLCPNRERDSHFPPPSAGQAVGKTSENVFLYSYIFTNSRCKTQRLKVPLATKCSGVIASLHRRIVYCTGTSSQRQAN